MYHVHGVLNTYRQCRGQLLQSAKGKYLKHQLRCCGVILVANSHIVAPFKADKCRIFDISGHFASPLWHARRQTATSNCLLSELSRRVQSPALAAVHQRVPDKLLKHDECSDSIGNLVLFARILVSVITFSKFLHTKSKQIGHT